MKIKTLNRKIFRKIKSIKWLSSNFRKFENKRYFLHVFVQKHLNSLELFIVFSPTSHKKTENSIIFISDFKKYSNGYNILVKHPVYMTYKRTCSHYTCGSLHLRIRELGCSGTNYHVISIANRWFGMKHGCATGSTAISPKCVM